MMVRLSLELSKNLGWLISYVLKALGVDVNKMPVLEELMKEVTSCLGDVLLKVTKLFQS